MKPSLRNILWKSSVLWLTGGAILLIASLSFLWNLHHGVTLQGFYQNSTDDFLTRQNSFHNGITKVENHLQKEIKKLEKEKIIRGYTAIIDHEKLGYSLTAIIEIIAKNDKILDIEEEISKFENVCGVYDITGSTDTLVIAKFKERNELSKFVKELASISNVENTITHVVLNTTKEDFRLS